jgi:cell shape-determining protein MreC
LYYKGYQRVKKENTKLYQDFISLQCKYDNLDTTIRNTLIKLQSDIDLEKENIQLKKEIEELKQKLQKNEKKNS